MESAGGGQRGHRAALGHEAPGSCAKSLKLTSIPEETGVPSTEDMILAERASDQATLDLLTQRMPVHEKTAWMLRSLLQ